MQPVPPRVPPGASLQGRGAPKPEAEPLPRAAPAARRRHQGGGCCPSPAARAGTAPADKLTCGRRRRRHPRPPSRAASERSPGAAAAAERVRTCSVPPPCGTYHRGDGGARRERGQSWMLPRGRAKNRRRRKEQLELKGAAAVALPAAPGKGRLLPPHGPCPRSRRTGSAAGACAAVGLSPRSQRRRGTASGALPASRGARGARATASCPRLCGGSAAVRSAAAAEARRGAQGAERALGVSSGATGGLCPLSPQRRAGSVPRGRERISGRAIYLRARPSREAAASAMSST